MYEISSMGNEIYVICLVGVEIWIWSGMELGAKDSPIVD
jgi:hypothetical protein